MKISELFKEAQGQKKKLFIPYITAGDPNLKSTGEFLIALQEGGASIIELGVPFSDPIADGSAIQRASERALKQGTTVAKTLQLIKDLRKSNKLKAAIVIFTYLNPLLKFGFEKFVLEAAEAGVSGLLIVDLPPEEAKDYALAANKNGLETIFLSSPTTSPERLEIIEEMSTGFVYYVSRLGVTGIQKEISKTLESEISHIRKTIKKPIAVGFGISNAEQAKGISRFSDAVIVGSATVSIIEKNPKVEDAKAALLDFTKSMVTAVN